MIDRRILLMSAGLAALFGFRLWRPETARAAEKFEVEKTADQWRAQLTPMQYHILREEGTERPFTSPLLKEHRKGTYACAGCELPLFSSDTKFDSGTGWPSFTQAAAGNVVAYKEDRAFGMSRVEVLCNVCDAHLGHVFPDGPPPTGLRYCINALSLEKQHE